MAFDPAQSILRNSAGYPVPQYWDDVAQAWKAYQGYGDVGGKVLLYDINGNPLLTAANPGVVQGAAAEGADAAGNPLTIGVVDGSGKARRVSATYPVPTQLTGRNVEEIYAFNALAIRETGNKTCTPYPIDLSKYRSVQMTVTSTLDQQVTIDLYVDGSDKAAVWNGTAWTQVSAVIPAVSPGPSRGIVLNSLWTFLNNAPFPGTSGAKCYMMANCSTAPTAGSLTVRIEGVPN